MGDLRKMIAIDAIPNDRLAKEKGLDFFPLKEFINFCKADDVDVIETLITLPRMQPHDDSPEAAAQVNIQFDRKRYALEMSGAKVIECPTKRSPNGPSGFKHSDDQRLMITTLTLAMKLRPDFVILVAADGDFAPMVEALRNEGIRTEVVASFDMLANDLRRQAVNVVDLNDILAKIAK